ncbi:MAG: helix-turn-helix transcriptional regulator [Eubacteriales bacterium]|nr:helix-turn-helix transcriptional regulator [Eubacteriales bacterium]
MKYRLFSGNHTAKPFLLKEYLSVRFLIYLKILLKINEKEICNMNNTTEDKTKDFSNVNYMIGRRIKEARIKKNLKQEYIAEKINISATHYSNIENGHRSCTMHKFVQICSILNETPGHLLRDVIAVKQENDIDELIQQLSPENKKLLEAVITTYCQNQA